MGSFTQATSLESTPSSRYTDDEEPETPALEVQGWGLIRIGG